MSDLSLQLQQAASQLPVSSYFDDALFQRELTTAVEVPVFASSLLLVPLVSRMLRPGRRVGVVTADGRHLTARHLEGAGVDPDSVVVAGLEGCPEFEEVVFRDRHDLDVGRMEAEVVEAATGLVARHPEVRALLLECSLLPPFAHAVQAATRLPVFDFTTLIDMVHAALARKPELLLVDEYAHSNAPGSRHPKRWQDVEELLAAGIDVWTTLNVQHLESLLEVVWKITGVRQRETVPDSALSRADEIELIDITPSELRERMADGKVYMGTNQKGDTGFEKAVLLALNEADGKVLWKIVHDIPNDPIFAMARSEGLCSTPTIEGKFLYYVTPGCEVVCADTGGKVVWKYDMFKELKVSPFHLSNCSPVIVGDQAVRERRYRITAAGTRAWRQTRQFYETVAAAAAQGRLANA